MYAPGGLSLAPPADYVERLARDGLREPLGRGRPEGARSAEVLAGQIASASPFVSLQTQGIYGSAVPAELETALQLLHQRFVAPGDDPDAFALLKRQLDAARRQPRCRTRRRCSATRSAR